MARGRLIEPWCATRKRTPTPRSIRCRHVWTGTWRDPRFSPPADGGRPENALTGTIFMVNDGATDVHRRYRPRTARCASGATPASPTLRRARTATLPFGTLGYEWDEDLDNGFRPAGLIRMSTTTVPNAPVLQDYGSTFGSGTATHSLTLYKHSSGALVFGAGTVQWPWGLDANHDRAGTPTDVRMQQATVNLFADMGVAARHACNRAWSRRPLRPIRPRLFDDHRSGRGLDGATGQPVTISGTARDTGGASWAASRSRSMAVPLGGGPVAAATGPMPGRRPARRAR